MENLVSDCKGGTLFRIPVIRGSCRHYGSCRRSLENSCEDWIKQVRDDQVDVLDARNNFKQEANPANGGKTRRFLVFHDRARTIDLCSAARYRLRSAVAVFAVSKLLNAKFCIGTKFLCCVCSMPVFGDILLGSFSPKTCFLCPSTIIFLWPPLPLHATCHCHCGHGRLTGRG